MCISTKAFIILNINHATNFKPGRIAHLFRWSYVLLFGFTNLIHQVSLVHLHRTSVKGNKPQ